MKLGVNIDHVATVRQARMTFEPDPARAAAACEEAGADSIVLHLREDRRHIQERDLELIKKTINIKINLEMAAEESVIEKALQALPGQATLVPEKREELTTEGGLDAVKHEKKIASAVKRLGEAGIPASLFIEPEEDQIKAAENVGADSVELHTGVFAAAFMEGREQVELGRLRRAVEAAKTRTGLAIHAGHGLTYLNTGLIAALQEIEELNIGHSIISRAVFTGIRQAVKDMLQIINREEIKRCLRA